MGMLKKLRALGPGYELASAAANEIERLRDRVAELEKRIDIYEDRLEIKAFWVDQECDDGLVRKVLTEVPPDERPGMTHNDAIAMRDKELEVLAETSGQQRVRVAELEARLEVDREWISIGDGELVLREIPPEDRPTEMDAVDCRDATISILRDTVKIKNHRIAELESALRLLIDLGHHATRFDRDEARKMLPPRW